MQRLLEYAQAGDTAVVWRVDRLGRSLIGVLNTVNGLRDAGINVRSISDGIDPATSTGRPMLNMLATLAEYERELIVERVNAGIAVAREAGTQFGRPKSDLGVVGEKLAIVAQARFAGKTAAEAAQLVGWSRATLYCHQNSQTRRSISHNTARLAPREFGGSRHSNETQIGPSGALLNPSLRLSREVSHPEGYATTKQ
jgi:DNA invertase Pin-like site-specific DNA recombinase